MLPLQRIWSSQSLLSKMLIVFLAAVFAAMPLSHAVQANETPYTPVPYEEIGSILSHHVQQSDRVSMEVIGQSALGHDLYEVVISEPGVDLEEVKAMRKEMLQNPGKIHEWIDENPDFKVPLMINGSIHGNEYPGVDAILKLIERFAYQHDETTKRILQHNVLVFNVVVNPDGRILGTRQNGNGFDINRDHVTLSQPEAVANVDLITEWNPMVHLDLHGFVKRSDDYPGLIEPCTIPHNPNYEYDLFIEFALDQAEAMEAELVANKENFETDLYRNMKGTHIPYRDAEDGWDDYPPIFTPMYAMHHGVYGYTLETPTNSVDGVEWHYNAVMGALKFATDHKVEMTRNQLEIFRRGVEFDHVYHEEGFFPRAYVLPVDPVDPTATVKAVKALLRHDVDVMEAEEAFTVDGKTYDRGTYVVKLDQAKRSLANTLLWDGEDISDQAGAMYDISAWNLPDLWGFEAIPTHDTIDIPLKEVENVETEGTLVGEGPYEIPNSSVGAVALVNQIMSANLSVYRGGNGHYYVEGDGGDALRRIVQQSGITLHTKAIPDDAEALDAVNVAILDDGGQHGTRTALKQLGFDVTEIEPSEIAEHGLDDFDVLVVNGSGQHKSAAYRERIHAFLSNGGKYVAIGAGASGVAVDLGLTDTTVHTAGRSGRDSNGVVHVHYRDTSLTAGYGERDVGFVYNPVWYTDIEDDRVVASYADQDFFKAGFWKNSEAAAGQPVIIKGHHPGVTLIGLEVGFRAHPEYLYRLLSNVIYPGRETVLTTADGTKERVARFKRDGELQNDEAARSLMTHLTAVARYEEEGVADKVVKHVHGFKRLLEHQRENGWITEKAYTVLKSDADSLIAKWDNR